MYVCMCVFVSVCLSVCLSVFLSGWLAGCLSVCMYEFPDDNKQEILELKLFSIFC